MVDDAGAGGLRRFTFWCVRCPTRVAVESELNELIDCAALARVGPQLDDNVIADRCPSCGEQMYDVEELILFGNVRHPWRPEETSEIHRQWREVMR